MALLSKKEVTEKAVAVNKKPEEYNLMVKPDRIGKYFKKYLDQFVFDTFTDEFIQNKNIDFMKGVPIPLRKEDLESFQKGGLKIALLAENMAWVMGCDPHFKHNSAYIAYLKGYFNKKMVEGLLKEGRDAAEQEEYDDAAVHFRAALCIDPTYLHALYSYARVCRVLYSQPDHNEEYIGNFKAESLQMFELLQEFHPQFAQTYYYLGYAYVNMGLYIKAKLTWEEFVTKSRNSKDRKEIRQRIEQLKMPVEIESGYNAVLAGKWQEGVKVLEPYLNTNYKTWWPLSYYLGIAYVSLGYRQKAVDRFKHVLTLSPSNVEAMEELADIYAVEKDETNEQKYRKKAQLLRDNGHKEKAFQQIGEKKGKRKKNINGKMKEVKAAGASPCEEKEQLPRKKFKRLGGKKNETTDDRQ